MNKIIWVIVLIIIGSVLIYTYETNATFDSKPALKIVVTTNPDENDTIKILNMTFEQTTIPFFYKRIDSPASFPEISIMTRYNTLNSEPMAFWSARPYSPETEGSYALTITFRDGKEPKVGDILILSVKTIGYGERLIEKKTAFYEWKG